MNESTPMPGVAEQRNSAKAFIGTMVNSGADAVRTAQADLLESVATSMADWLQRRQEAVVDAQRLISQLQSVSGPAEMLKAQQEWMGGAFQRMTADAAAYQASAMQLIEKSRHWVGRKGDAPNEASQPQAGRATGLKPVPVANKAQ